MSNAVAPQRTEEWFEARRGRLNASELGTVLGLNESFKQDGQLKPVLFETPTPKPFGERYYTPQVSSQGRVRGKNGVVKTPNVASNGYAYVGIYGKALSVHRVMALSFKLIRKRGQDDVNHLQGKVNKLGLLEWSTRSENIRYSYATNKARKSGSVKRSKPICGRCIGDESWISFPGGAPDAARRTDKNRRSCAAKMCKPIYGRKKGEEEWQHFPGGVCEAARELKLSQGHISLCVNKKQKQTGGYEFKWAAPTEPERLPGEFWVDVNLNDTYEGGFTWSDAQ